MAESESETAPKTNKSFFFPIKQITRLPIESVKVNEIILSKVKHIETCTILST